MILFEGALIFSFSFSKEFQSGKGRIDQFSERLEKNKENY